MSEPAWDGVRVLVLGAGGFIGRWVARAAAARGATVVRSARAAAGGDTFVADLSRPDTAAALLAHARPDVVFNLAGYGVDPAERDPAMAEHINSGLPAELCAHLPAASERWTGARLIHTGSALEYGTAAGDLNEQTHTTPTTLYGRTKLEGTRRLLAEATARGIPCAVARLFTVYGHGEHPGRLLPTLLEARGHDLPIPLTDGLQRRDFTYVEDVADGLLRIAAAARQEPGVVNVATGRLVTVRAFAEQAADVLGIARPRLRFGDLATRPEEMRHDDVNVEKLRRLTGWVPATSIADGVRRAAAAYR